MKKNKYKDMLDGLIDTTLLYACKEHKTFVEEDVAECRPLLDEACDKAEKYDEKETPKKPLYSGRPADTQEYCPKCHSRVADINYCWNCGQKLDRQQK